MCEDVWEGFVEHLELLNVGVVISDGMEVLAFPSSVREGASVCSAHEADVSVVKACFVKVLDSPKFSG